tara:strand:+ start:428 stop:1552 length:1125 start_codon:yes stop_codon:yes gene_type:complete
MKFIVSSSILLKNLQILNGVINTSNTLPILDNFLLDISKDKLNITASDLETRISTVIDIQSESVGSLALPSKMLLEILKSFPDQPLTMSISDNNILEINANNGKYSIGFFPGEDYPSISQLKDPDSTTINSEVLLESINRTLFATGNDDLRPVMSGVFFQLTSSNFTFVATDAHKLVKYSRNDLKSENTTEFIMPKKPLQILKGILQNIKDDINIDYNENNVQFSFDSTKINCRLVEGKYPNYEAVIPKENPNVMNINRDIFLNSVKRVSIFSNKTTHQVRLKIAGSELNIFAEDVDFNNKADERLSCDYRGEDLQIGFNSRFLIEMLSNISSEEISFSFSSPNKAGIIQPLFDKQSNEEEETIMLIMPVMLNQ